MELDAATASALLTYLEAHPPTPAKGMGSVQTRFLDPVSAPTREPKVEYLLRGEGIWLIRWPTGALRWVQDDYLERRGMVAPPQPVIAHIRDPQNP